MQYKHVVCSVQCSMCSVKEVYMFRFRGICTELAPAQCLWGAEIQTSVKSRFKLILKKYSPIIHYLFWKHAMAPNKSVFSIFWTKVSKFVQYVKNKKTIQVSVKKGLLSEFYLVT